MMSEAIDENEWEMAPELADDLLHWLARGGFPPTITSNAVFDKIGNKAVFPPLRSRNDLLGENEYNTIT